MPRRARSKVLDDGCYAHVYSRALERRNIFREGDDFQCFKRLLTDTKQKYSYRIHHYCLMNTHFHLAVSVHQVAAFSAALREIKQDYVRWYNEKYEHKGPVWWGRFGSRLIQDETYLLACGTYIELNPVKAGLVAAPEEWKYSSSCHYFLGKKDDLIDDYDCSARADLREVESGDYIGSRQFVFDKQRALRE